MNIEKYYKIHIDYKEKIPNDILAWFEKKYHVIGYLSEKDKNLNLSMEEIRNFESLAYTQIEVKQKQERKEKWLSEGWQELNCEIIKKAFEEKKKIILNRLHSGFFGKTQTEKKLKPFVDNQGTCYLMEPRATRKGFLVSGLMFEECYIKVEE